MLCPVLKAVSAAQNLLWRGKGQQALGAGGGAGPLWEEGCPCQYLALGVVASAACPGHVLHGLGAIFPKRASPLSCPPWHCCPGPWQVPWPLLHPDLWQEFGPWVGGGVERRSELASFSSCCKGLGVARFCKPLRLLKELGTRRYGPFQAHLWPLLPGELTIFEGPGSLPSFQVSSLLTLLASTVGGGTVLGTAFLLAAGAKRKMTLPEGVSALNPGKVISAYGFQLRPQGGKQPGAAFEAGHRHALSSPPCVPLHIKPLLQDVVFK